MKSCSIPRSFVRILSVLMTLILIATTAIIPVGAAEHNHDGVDMEATYGKEVTLSVRGEYDYAAANEVLTLVNAARKKVGKAALKMDKDMMEAAMLRAAECSVYYAHTRPNGEECFSAFPSFNSAGENVAAGFPDAESAMEGWMASPGHKANILDEEDYGYRSIGIGVFKIDDTYYWSQLFNGYTKKADPTEKKAVTKTVSIKARTKLLDLSINKSELTLNDGETDTLTVTNRNITFPYVDHTIGGLTYASANIKVATVSSEGVVTSAGDGTTDVLVKSGNGVTLFTVPVQAQCRTINVTLSNTATGVKVTWNKVTGAAYYKVFKSVYENGKWSSYTTLKTTKTLSATDKLTSGTKVKYAVYPYADGSQMDTHETVTTTYLAQPTVKVANTSTGVTVSWKKIAGATSYKVYRSVYSNGKWSSYVSFKTTKSTSWTNTSVKSGQKVRYTVYACKDSYKSAAKTGVATAYLTQPKAKVANTSTGVKVSWGKVTGATSYKVYKSEYKSGKWSSYKAVKSTKTVSYTDTKVKTGQKVRYTVYACKDGYKSAEKSGVSDMFLSQPKVKLAKATKGVKVSWGKVTGATSYKVYRSVYKNGKWSAYTAYKTTKSTSYTDKSVKKGQKVRYTVYAYNGSYKSAEKSGVSITR